MRVIGAFFDAIRADQALPWLMAIVAVWAIAIVFILFALCLLAPALWREGLAQMRAWLRKPAPAVVVELDAHRRKELNAALDIRR